MGKTVFEVTRPVALLGIGLVALLFPLSCMTMQTELPGILDLRQDLTKPADQPLEPKEPGLGRSDQSFLQGFTLSSSNETPTQGKYQHPEAPEHRSALAPKVHTSLYRRVVRQWFLVNLIPVAGDQGLFAADMQTELSIPGSHLRKIRITSGQDIAAHLFPLIPFVGGISQFVPTRTTEVVAYIDQPIKTQTQKSQDDITLVPVPDQAAAATIETSPEQPAASSDSTEHLAQPPVTGDAQ